MATATTPDPSRRRPTSPACPQTRSPTRTCTPAGSAATGRPPSSTSPRTPASGARTSPSSSATAALWNYCLFFWGEDAVADNLSPYIDAAPLRGAEVLPHHPAGRRGPPRGVLQALHAGGVRHRRRLHDQRPAGGQAPADPRLSQDLRPPRPHGRRAARRPLARQTRRRRDALPRRHRGRARPARPALHLQLPGEARPAPRVPRRAWRTSPPTSSATSASASSCSSDLNREDPVGVPKAVARMLRDVTRYTAQVLMPPGWDERYITVFDSTFDEVGVEGLTSMTTKLRSAGLPLESLPGPAAPARRPLARWRSPSAGARSPRPA